MKKKFSWTILAIVAVLAATPAAAHMLWLNPMDYYPQVGTTVDIGIGWGHRFTSDRTDEEVREGRVAAIQALDPEGKTVTLQRVSADRYRLEVGKAGAYVVTARIEPGFFSMTPEGRQWGNKKEVPNAVKCTHYHIEAKTVLIAGGVTQGFERSGGQTLALIPVSDLRALKVGGHFTARVLHEGEPLTGMQMKAVYAGFEKKQAAGPAEPGKSRHASGGHFPVVTATDNQGRAAIALEKAGDWLIVLSHKPAYPDRDTCDEVMYNVTYAFEVR